MKPAGADVNKRKKTGEAAVLTLKEAAAVLRIGRSTAYHAIRDNEIPHFRIGRKIFVPRAKLNGLLGETAA